MGKIRLNSADLPRNIYEMCREWHDGLNTAMALLYRDGEFSPFTLRREVVTLLEKSTPLIERDREKLKEVHTFAATECYKETARENIRQGIAKMRALGLDHEIDEVIREAKGLAV